MRVLTVLIGLLIAAVLLTGCLNQPEEVTATVSNASELQAAISNAESGDLIEMESGSYGDLTIQVPNTWEENVWVRPAAGATVNIGWRSKTPNLTLAGLVLNDEAPDDRTLIASIVYLYVQADGNEVIGVDRINQGHLASADDTFWVNNRFYDPTLGTNDSLQIKQYPAGDYPEDTYIFFNTFGPVYRKSSAHHGDCLQTLKTRNITINGNTFYPCSNAALQFDGQDTGITHVEDNDIYGCNPITTSGPQWCDSTGSVKGGSRPEMNFVNNRFHSGGFSLNVQGPGDMYQASGNTFDSLSWP